MSQALYLREFLETYDDKSNHFKGNIRTYLLLFAYSAFWNKRNNNFLSFARGTLSFFCFPLLYQYKIFIADISMDVHPRNKKFLLPNIIFKLHLFKD